MFMLQVVINYCLALIYIITSNSFHVCVHVCVYPLNILKCTNDTVINGWHACTVRVTVVVSLQFY